MTDERTQIRNVQSAVQNKEDCDQINYDAGLDSRSTMVPEMVPPTTCAGRGLELKAPRRSSSAAERQTTNFLESFAEPIAHLLNIAG